MIKSACQNLASYYKVINAFQRSLWLDILNQHEHDINMHFENKEIGHAKSLPGKMDEIPFHIFGMKELDYVMKLMSTYGTNGGVSGHTTKCDYVNSERKKERTRFNYPEVVSNHFKYWYSVDDHNAKRHAPICLEHAWVTTYWPHRPFSFFLAVTEVNVNFTEAFFVHHNASRSQLEFRKLIAKGLINNKYLRGKFRVQEIRKSKRKRALAIHIVFSHCHRIKSFSGLKSEKQKASILKLRALLEIKKFLNIVCVLQEYGTSV